MSQKSTRIRWIIAGLTMAVFLPCIASALNEQEQVDGFISLFNGKDLTGWKIMGNPAAWVIEEGTIHALPNLNGGVIESNSSYENFILRLEFKTGQNANSGVWFHVPLYGRQSRVGGEIQIYDSYGKEPTTTSCGALYDKIAPLTHSVKPAGEWNDMEIECQYPKLKVTINGTLVQDLDVSQDERIQWRNRFGPLALQEHGNNAWFRNVRVKDLGGTNHAEWQMLFPDKNINGWHAEEGTANWKYEGSKTILTIENDGVEGAENIVKDRDRLSQLGNATVQYIDPCITGAAGRGFLVSDKTYKNFELWAYVKTAPETLAGISIRWKSPQEPGYCVPIWNDPHDAYKTGSLLKFNKNIRTSEILFSAPSKLSKDGEWFPLQIIAQNQIITVIVNGQIMGKYENADPGEGSIALQVFSGNETQVSLQDVRLLPLP